MHILVPDNLSKDGLKILEQTEGFTVQAPSKMSREEVLEAVAQADGMIIRSGTKANAELLEKATQLKVIVRAGVGVDNVDLAKATEKGIYVMNTPAGNTIATAELAFGLMLALARHIPQANASLKEGKWDRKSFMGTELRGKTLGLIGFGRVGQAVAKRAQAFEMEVVAHDPYISEITAYEHGVKLMALDEIFTWADYISLHAITTPETLGLINAANIAKMKDGVRIINAARGALINDADLAEALKSGKVAGAALDVYEPEPPAADHPLISLPNVIALPHVGASSAEAQDAVAIEAAELMVAALQHGQYQNVVNVEVLQQ